MAGVVPVPPRFQFSSTTGVPLSGGFVDIYLAGTTTRTTTWQDKDQTSQNTNPIELDSAGSCTIFGADNKTYKLVIKNSAGVVQSHLGGDNISCSGSTADIAAAAAAAAQPYVDDAQAAQVAAEAAALEAENYAAAAATGAKFYDTIALGLAGTADTLTFGVKAGGTDGLTRPTVYRDNAGVATLLYAVVPGTEFDSEVDRIDSIVGAEFESIGRTGTPVTGGDNSDSTTIILRPVTQDGQIKRVRAYLGAGATALNVKVFRGSSSVLNQVSTTAITAAAGLNDFDADLAEFTAIDVLEGDILGWYVTGGRMQFAAGSSDPFQQTAGNVTTFTPSGTVSTAVFAIGFDIEHTDYLTREEAEATDRRSKRLGSTLTQTIGRPSGATLVTGTAAPGQTLVMEEAATEDGEITTVRLWALATGTFDVMAFDVVDGVFVATGEMLTLTAGSTGLNTFSDFTPLRIKRGQRIGFYGGSTRLARIAATSDSSGFYNGLGSASAGGVVFPKGTLFTTVQFQISFDISYFKSSAVQFVLTTQAAYDALGTKDADTLYGIV